MKSFVLAQFALFTVLETSGITEEASLRTLRGQRHAAVQRHAHAAMHRASTRSQISQQPEPGEQTAACTCDCCLSLEDDRAKAAGGSGGLYCQARSEVGNASTAAGCTPWCSVPDSEEVSYQSKDEEIDYVRFCSSKCRPAGEQTNVLCLSAESVETNDDGTDDGSADDSQSADAGGADSTESDTEGSAEDGDDDGVDGGAASALQAPAKTSPAHVQTLAELASTPIDALPLQPSARLRRAPVEQAMTQTKTRVQAKAQDGDEEEDGSDSDADSAQDPGAGASLSLAKGEMMQAKIHAEMAGEAARIAKEAFEKVVRSAKSMSDSAAMAALNEVKHEAALQAKEAATIRNNWENNAKKSAQNAAVAVAMVYKKAMVRDQALANTFQERAFEYAGAAAQRQTMANDFAAQAEDMRTRSQFALTKKYVLQAHQAMDQAQAFARDATAANNQAKDIMGSMLWYNYAEKAAAANMLAKSTPPDVAPPPLPPLP